MATTPYFVISPNTIVSLLGLMRGPDKTVPTPAEDWRQATVDVVIPALNEERNIVFCLASLLRQTLKPKRVILIDDGSRDRTCENARAYAESVGMDLIVIKRKAAIGKTPTIKRQAREFDSDVEFILDGDTVLESENYIARTVEELYKGVGIASACGTILPLRERDRRTLLAEPGAAELPEGSPRHRALDPRRLAVAGPLGHHQHVPGRALPLPAEIHLPRADGLLRHHHQPGGVRRGLPPPVHQGPVRPLRADPRRRPHKLRGHLHRLRPARPGLSQHPAHRRLRPLHGAGGAPPAPADLLLVVVFSAELLLFRRSAAKSLQGLQEIPPEGPGEDEAAQRRRSRKNVASPRPTGSPSASSTRGSSAGPWGGYFSLRRRKKSFSRPPC